MEKVLEILNRMQADGVFQNFAIGGGIATIYYLEAYQTDDIDVFISPVVIGDNGLVSFGGIYEYLHSLGYPAEREYINIEGWLVQFVPASEPVQQEAVEQADRVAFAGAHTFIFSAEHLTAELLRSGRPKDHVRVISLLESEQLDMPRLRAIINRNGLRESWQTFCSRYDIDDHE